MIHPYPKWELDLGVYILPRQLTNCSRHAKVLLYYCRLTLVIAVGHSTPPNTLYYNLASSSTMYGYVPVVRGGSNRYFHCFWGLGAILGLKAKKTFTAI